MTRALWVACVGCGYGLRLWVAFAVAFGLRLCNTCCVCIAFGRNDSVAFALRLELRLGCVCVLRLRLCAAELANGCKFWCLFGSREHQRIRMDGT